MNPIVVALVGTLVLLLTVCFAPFIPLFLLANLYGRRRARAQFLAQFPSGVVFCYSARRAWYDFVRNNAIPALPAEITGICVKGGPKGDNDRAVLLRRVIKWIRRETISLPYCMIWTKKRPERIPLHDLLAPLKQYAARDDAVQAQIAVILAGRMAQRSLEG